FVSAKPFQRFCDGAEGARSNDDSLHAIIANDATRLPASQRSERANGAERLDVGVACQLCGLLRAEWRDLGRRLRSRIGVASLDTFARRMASSVTRSTSRSA